MNLGLVVLVYHTPVVCGVGGHLIFYLLVFEVVVVYWWWWCSSGGVDGCYKVCNSDCCSIAILKCIFSGSFGGTSCSEGVLVLVMVVMVGYWG